jgi:hypothetical protein
MTTGGWFVMILSVGGATGFFTFCITRVLMAKDAARPHDPGEPDDVDLEEHDERYGKSDTGN